jgi:hypothetical protein
MVHGSLRRPTYCLVLAWTDGPAGSIFTGVRMHLLDHRTIVLFAAAPGVGELPLGARQLTGNDDMTDSVRFPGATHLECTGTGDHLESEQLIGLSPAGKPLFARYDLDSIKRDFTPDAVACRRADLWRYAEVLPVRDPACQVSLGEG